VSSAPQSIEPPCSLEALRAHPHEVLKDEGEGAARVVRYDLPDGPVVLKAWAPRSRVLGAWARVLMRREAAHYALLDGTPGIPRFRGAYGPQAFLIEFIPGAAPLKRKLGPEVIGRALDELERVLAAVHARRFVHLDLHQRLNVLVGRHGGVWLIDLGQGLDCSRGWRRLLFPLGAWVDRRALVKFRARYVPASLSGPRAEKLVEQHKRRRGRGWKAFNRRVRALFLGGEG